MKIPLDINRYKKLLEKEKGLKKQNSSLIYQNREEFSELLSYPARVQKQIAYERRFEYLFLMSKYINKKISLWEFGSEFIQRTKEDSHSARVIRDDLTQLENFSVDLKAAEFSSLTSQLSADAKVAQEFRPEEGISDEQFHKSIEKTYCKMQKFISPIDRFFFAFHKKI